MFVFHLFPQSLDISSSSGDEMETVVLAKRVGNCPRKKQPQAKKENVQEENREMSARPLMGEKPLVKPNLHAENKIAMSKFQMELKNLNLEELLEGSLDGRAVLNYYKVNSCFDEDLRHQLVDIVVKWILFRNIQPRKNDFIAMRSKILLLFPKEENVYYIAPREDGKNQTLARGKLFDRTKNVKEWMRRRKLLPRVQVTKSTEANEIHGIELTKEVKDAMTWLESRREPWKTVEEKWSITSKYRMSLLLSNREEDNRKNPERLSVYIQTNKVLRLKDGYTLVEIDFTSKFGVETADALVHSWPKFRNLIVSMIRSKTISVKDPEGKAIWELLLNCSEKDRLDVLLVQLLPSLVVPTRMVQWGNKKFKPSIKESRDTLLCRVNNTSQVENYIVNKRAEAFERYGGTASVQPYILCVGSEHDLGAASNFCVCVDNFSYSFISVVQALDVCFKVFFALDTAFPVQCAQVWFFIQRYLYEITTPEDVSILNVTSFIQRLKNGNIET